MHDELTKVDLQKMQEEIDYRVATLTPQLKEMLKSARDLGDLSENDEYRSAKRELNRNYSRIRYLKSMIETAIVIEDHSSEDTIGLYDKVTLLYEDNGEEKTVSIVTTLRNDVLSGYISKESPFGKALLDHKVGDRIKIQVNDKYSYYVQVKNIEKGHDDGSLKISEY